MSPKKVLVVEDVALIRMTTVDMLEQLGYESAEAADAKQALDMLRQDASIGIMLTDLGLPGMPGHELVEKARDMRPELRIVIASGYSAPESQALGGMQYLGKPFDMEQLQCVLEEG